MSKVKARSARPAVFVLMTLALSATTLSNIVSGSDSAMDAGEHLAAAILTSWFAVKVVGYLLDSYKAASSRRHQAQQSEDL